MFKRKAKEPGFEIKNLGGLIVERVQMPHSLQELDSTTYKVLTWGIEWLEGMIKRYKP